MIALPPSSDGDPPPGSEASWAHSLANAPPYGFLLVVLSLCRRRGPPDSPKQTAPDAKLALGSGSR
eukprot:2227128-Pyramimonas_sp.AAC.1